jgi:hypothetical protein
MPSILSSDYVETRRVEFERTACRLRLRRFLLPCR